MFDQFIGLLMLGLGIKTPGFDVGAVKGETTQVGRAPETDSRTSSGNSRGSTGENRVQAPRPSPFFSFDKTEQDVHRATATGEFETVIKTEREHAQEQIKTREKELKKKLSTFKDEHKRELIASLSGKLGDINANRTSVWTEHLTKLSTILEKIVTRSAEAKAKGKDVSSVETAIASAQSAIGAAQVALAAQAGKAYSISITSELKAKGDVGTAMSGLEGDLKTTYQVMQAAYRAVSDAVRALSHVLGEDVREGQPSVPSTKTTP